MIFKYLDKKDDIYHAVKEVLGSVQTSYFSPASDYIVRNDYITLICPSCSSGSAYANEIADMSLGIHSSSCWNTGAEGTGLFWCDAGNPNAPSSECYKSSGSYFNFREQTNKIYKRYAEIIYGDRNAIFKIPTEEEEVITVGDYRSDEIKEALFIHFKRNIYHDYIKPKIYDVENSFLNSVSFRNVITDHSRTTSLLTDADSYWREQGYSDAEKLYSADFNSQMGKAGILSIGVNEEDVTETPSSYKYALSIKGGLIFYDIGLLVLRLSNTNYTQVTEHISHLRYAGHALRSSCVYLNASEDGVKHYNNYNFNEIASSGSYHQMLLGFKYALSTSSGLYALTCIQTTKTYQTIYLLNLKEQEFNYSSNPTSLRLEIEEYPNYGERKDRHVIRMVQSTLAGSNDVVEATSRTQTITSPSRAYITVVGFYDELNRLLAVGRLSKAKRKSFCDSYQMKVVLSH